MKQDFDSPVDSLLRDYAHRRAARASSVRADAVPEQSTIDRNNMEHLDADEMAAFAENALPDAAHARAVAHLADCDGCRQVVVALTHAENIAPESVKSIPPQSIRSRPSWREKFAAFFALPATLRYAVPALAAVLFIALVAGIMFNRRQPEATLVASKQETQTTSSLTDSAPSDTENSMSGNANATAKPASEMSNSVPTSNTATAAATTTTTTTTTTTANTATVTRRAANANSSLNAKEASATSASQNNSSGNASDNLPLVANITPSPATNERQYFDNDAARAPKRDRAAAPPSAANVNANVSGNSAGVAATQNEEAIAISNSNQAAKASRAEASSNAAQASDSSSFSTEARAASRRRAPSSPPAAKNVLPVNGRTVNGADASAALLPSRRVSGRDFRRQGTRWIDAAYTRSQATTNIARGSKQFRALINAEPGIGKIAAQLDGEVIIVWKGRAYRIH